MYNLYFKDGAWGKIGFDNHKVTCLIGVNPEERIHPQDLFIDLRVKFDFSKCGASDNYQDTLCYVSLARICAQVAMEGKFQLLETLAMAILSRLKSEFNIPGAFVRIKKPAAIASAEHTLVELSLGEWS